MAMLNDVSSGALPADDPTKQVESMVRQVNEWARSISNEDRTKIYKDESGTNRIILGLLPDKTIGLKISQPDIDVVGAGDDELVFNSNQNVFKIVMSGSWTNTTALTPVAPGAGTFGGYSLNEVMVEHNLGYVPVVIAYLDFGDGEYVLLPWHNVGAFSGSNAKWITYSVFPTETDLRFDLNALFYGTSVNTFPIGSIPVKWYLLRESAN